MDYRKKVDEDVHGILVLAAPWLGEVNAESLRSGAKFRWMQLSGGALGAIRVVAVHAAAPVPGLTQDWSSDIATLRQRCELGNGSNVLIGDFNATVDHSLLRSAISGCTDAAAERGQGLVATWPSYFPQWLSVQIDHVFTSADLRPASIEVLDIPGSDHRALLSRVIVPSALVDHELRLRCRSERMKS